MPTLEAGVDALPFVMLDREQSLEDEMLLREIGLGCPHAFGVLSARYLPGLTRAALRIVRDHHEAEDIVQEVLLILWQKADQFDPRRCSPYAWSVTILRRRAIDRLRWRKRQETLLQSYRTSGRQPDEDLVSASRGGAALDAADRQVIRCAIEALPTALKRVLELAYFEGLTHHQIAVRLGAPLGTVKGHIRQAHLRLKSLLCRTGFLNGRGEPPDRWSAGTRDSAGENSNPLAS